MSRVFEKIIEILGWLQIVASPLLFGFFIGAAIYFPNPTPTRLTFAVGVIVSALIFGIWFATRIYKTKGTMWFLSRIMATPELDETPEKKESPKVE